MELYNIFQRERTPTAQKYDLPATSVTDVITRFARTHSLRLKNTTTSSVREYSYEKEIVLVTENGTVEQKTIKATVEEIDALLGDGKYNLLVGRTKPKPTPLIIDTTTTTKRSVSFGKPTTKTQQLEDKLTDYNIVAELGKGAQATVYKATRKSTNKTVALKVYKFSTSTNKDFAKYAEEEIHVLRSLKDCSVIACYDDHFYNPAGDLVLITEFLEGKDLFYRITETKLSTSTKINIVKTLLTIFRYIHNRGVAHRDIKPENIILLDKDDSPRLIDFGLGCILCGCVGSPGSPVYSAPEILRHSYTEQEQARMWQKADMWSIGVVICVLDSELDYNYKVVPAQNIKDMKIEVLRNIAEDCLQLDPPSREEAGVLYIRYFKK